MAKAFFSNEGNGPTYEEVLETLRTAGFPTIVTTRAGPDLWDTFAYGAGSLADLLPKASKLQPDRADWSPDVHIYCAGLVSLENQIEVMTTLDVDIEQLIARTGGRERVDPAGFNQVSANGKYRIWWLITDDARFVVERTVRLLDDPDVLGAQPVPNCPSRVPEDSRTDPGCDFRTE